MRVQTTVADPTTVSTIASTRRIVKNLDYLAARLHGRRSRMAEGERLDGLCRLRSLQEYFRMIFPETEFTGVLDFQRRLLHELIDELSRLSSYMGGPGADLVDWMLVRFQVENLKLLIRVFLTKTPVEEMYGLFAPLSGKLALDIQGFAAAQSLEDICRLVPKGILRYNLGKALEIYRDHPRPFFFEAALDRGYFQGLITRMEQLSQEDREIVRPIIYQEVDIFNLMLVLRGKFHYNLPIDMLKPLHVASSKISREIFSDMLNDPDMDTSAGRVAERVLDITPSGEGLKDRSIVADVSTLEGLAWKRFLRLANLAFRKSHMGLGAIIGYVGLRRVEVANLITVSEGIYNTMTAENIRRRLILNNDVERAHV